MKKHKDAIEVNT